MRIRLALKGRNKVLDLTPVVPLQGVDIPTPDPVPRAMPWAGMSLPLRGEFQEVQLKTFVPA